MPFLQEMVEYMKDEGVGTPGAAVNGIFVSSKAVLPTGPGPILSIRSTGGTTPDRTHNSITLPAYERPSAQLVVRATDFNVAEAMALKAWRALAKIRNRIVGEVTYTISSLTRSGSTATATTTAPHRFVNNQIVEISGATQSQYNGTFSITVTGSSTFTYTVTGSPATPATGTIEVDYAGSWYREVDVEQSPFDLGLDPNDERARVAFNISAVKVPS